MTIQTTQFMTNFKAPPTPAQTTRSTDNNGFFSNVFTIEDLQNVPLVDDRNPQYPLNDLVITEAEVLNILEKLRPISLQDRMESTFEY